jgi:hypothetical protein
MWVNLDGCNTFSEMVRVISTYSNHAGTSTNFYAALDLILTVIREKRIAPEQVENMVLVILSDMQINACLYIENGGDASAGYTPGFVLPADKLHDAKEKWRTFFTEIKRKYAETGMELYGQPLSPPHILFWNLRSTSGFPSLSTEENCTMMSGYDPSLLNDFCELGMNALKDYSPWLMFIKGLANPRYEALENVFRQLYTPMKI